MARLSEQRLWERVTTLGQKGYNPIPESDYLETISALRAEQAELVAGAYLDAAQHCRTMRRGPGLNQSQWEMVALVLESTAVGIESRTPADAKAAMERLYADKDADIAQYRYAVNSWKAEQETWRYVVNSWKAEQETWKSTESELLATIERLQAQLKELEGIDKVCDHSNETIGLLQADVERLQAELAESQSVIKNLSMLIRSLVHKHHNANLANRAKDYLVRKGLQGSILRGDTSPIDAEGGSQ